MNSINLFFSSIIFLTFTTFAQPEEARWNQVSIEYGANISKVKKDYSFKNEEGNFSLLKSLLVTYRIFFSDLDGEHCPYSPSCSQFAYEAANKVGILEAIPLTFDRLSRDLNLFRNYKNMTITAYGKIYDPVELRAISIMSKSGRNQ